MGAHASTWSPPGRCRTGWTSTTRRSRWSTTRAILPAEALPTFNSHAIESALHKVPDLAEHFVYFNDDFFLGRPLRPEAFFSPAGLAAVFLSPNPIGLTDTPDAPPYLKAAWNNRRLLQEAFGRVITDNLAHAPYPHRRSVLEEIEARFPDAIAGTARSPFRSDTDVSTLSSLAQHYGLMTGAAYVARRGARLRQRLQQRPGLAAQADPGPGPGLHLPRRPPRPRAQRRPAQPHPHGVHAGVLPGRRAVGEGRLLSRSRAGQTGFRAALRGSISRLGSL